MKPNSSSACSETHPVTGTKIYFLSDAHLGARYHKDAGAAEKKLVSWLDRIKHDAAAVYFLGDMFDYWYEYKYVAPKGFVRFLGKLAELSDHGIEIHLFTGNHDIWMFDYLPSEIGAVIHRDVLTVDLLGKRFFLGHGDEMDYRSKTFRFLRTFFRNPVCQFLYGGIHPRWTFGFALRWSHSSRTEGLKKADSQSADAGKYLIDFANAYLKTHPDINYFIFGHIHVIRDCPLNDNSRLILAGDWINHFSFVEWDGKMAIVRKYQEND